MQSDHAAGETGDDDARPTSGTELLASERMTHRYVPAQYSQSRPPDAARRNDGNWTTRGYANSRIANSRTGQVADWTTRGLTDATKITKTKHAKSPVASAS